MCILRKFHANIAQKYCAIATLHLMNSPQTILSIYTLVIYPLTYTMTFILKIVQYCHPGHQFYKPICLFFLFYFTIHPDNLSFFKRSQSQHLYLLTQAHREETAVLLGVPWAMASVSGSAKRHGPVLTDNGPRKLAEKMSALLIPS